MMTDELERPPDELLIDTCDESLVRGKLTDLAPDLLITGVDSDYRLGLSRLRLGNAQPALSGLVPPTGNDDPMDLLVSLLQEWSSTLRTPVGVDRNRESFVVTSLPHVKGQTDLRPLDPVPDGVRVPTGRPTGPRVGVADARPFGHPDLAGRVDGELLVSSVPFVSELPGHATFVAGTVLHRAPDAVLVCRTVLEPLIPNTIWDVARRLAGFADERIEVLNMSFGCRTGAVDPLPLRRAVQLLARRGIVLVAAAGNTGADEKSDPAYPACFPEVLAVGATTAEGDRRGFNPDVAWLKLLAPGLGVTGPFLQGTVLRGPEGSEQPGGEFPSGYVTWSGSSFAAANVTGEIARRMAHCDVTATEARDQLLAGRCPDIRPAHESEG